MNANHSIIKLMLLMAIVGILITAPIWIYSQYVDTEKPVQEGLIVDNGYPGPETEALDTIFSTPTPILSEVQQILEYEQALKRDNLSDQERKSLENKIEILSRVATQRAISKEKLVTPHPLNYETHPLPTRPTGLRDGGTSDFHTWEAVIQNIWSQYGNNNEHITVYAGELGSSTKFPGRGVIYILRLPALSIRGASRNEYLLPEGTGWVRISEVKGDILVLTSKEGDTFYFHLPGQQFVSSLTDTAPTVTPLPTSAPLPTIEPDSPRGSPYP